MDDRICYELRVISTATGTCLKCYSPKSLPPFKESLELFFNGIMRTYMLQRLFQTSSHVNIWDFFLACLFAGYVAYWEVWDFLWCVLIMIRVFQLQNTNFVCAYKQYGILFYKQTRSVWLRSTSYSSTFFSVWWIHQKLISDTYFLLCKYRYLFVLIQVVCSFNFI